MATKGAAFDLVDWKLRLSDPWYQLVVKMLLSVAPTFDGREILEIGCGVGGFCVNVAQRGAKVVGVDLSPRAVRKGRDLAKQLGLERRVDFLVADALHLPFRDGVKETVVCCEVLEHVPDHKKGFSELVRVTKKSGYLCLTVPNLVSSLLFEVIILRLVGQPGYVKQQVCVEKEDVFDVFKLRRLLDRKDLRVMKVTSANFFHVPPRVKRALKAGRVLQTASERIGSCFETHNLPFRLMGANLGVLARKECC